MTDTNEIIAFPGVRRENTDAAATTPDIPAAQFGQRHAILLTRDPASTQWAPKWLAREGFETRACDNIDEVETALAELPRSVIIVEGSITHPTGSKVFKVIRDRLMKTNVPMVVLCAGAKEVELAVEAEVEEIVRRPFDWNVISRRASVVFESHRAGMELAKTKSALEDAQSMVADARRCLDRLENSDLLTGLPNVMRFRELLERAMSQSEEVAVFVIGLDRFQLVNEALGYDAGNRVLKAYSQRLRRLLVCSEFSGGHSGFIAAAAAKLSGVRFGLFIPYSGDENQLSRIKDVLTNELSKPLEVDGQTLHLPSSVGAAISCSLSVSGGRVLRRAERTMLEVKRRGGGFGIHGGEEHRTGIRQFEMDRMLREAFDAGSLSLAFQPLVSVTNDSIVGAEALLRWEIDGDDEISPTDFVPVAERTGLIVPIGEQVIDAACCALRDWSKDGAPLIRMAVNVSLTQLRRGDVPRAVSDALTKYDLPPDALELELSERGVLGADANVLHEVAMLKEIGVRLSLDDFGTGDSAIKYLKSLPIDVLKLDRSYVNGAVSDPKDAAIASAMVRLGQDMQLSVVAEGVETPEQLVMVKSWGCDVYQGFLCAPAVSEPEFLELLGRRYITTKTSQKNS